MTHPELRGGDSLPHLKMPEGHDQGWSCRASAGDCAAIGLVSQGVAGQGRRQPAPRGRSVSRWPSSARRLSSSVLLNGPSGERLAVALPLAGGLAALPSAVGQDEATAGLVCGMSVATIGWRQARERAQLQVKAFR